MKIQRHATLALAWAVIMLSAPVFGLSWPVGDEEQVKAWEGSITLPTYTLPQEQDPNPHYAWFGEGESYYPYTTMDLLGVEIEEVVWRAYFLENEYLKITCLPDIGGRVYSVLDKSTGEEMFYKNEVIKPGLYAMRGAWISGGIEWNIGPRSHGVTSYSAVDVATQQHEDGSASLIIGGTDQSQRIEWQVRITLHPGRAYMDEQILLYNPTDSIQTYYFWNNTAFPEKEGTRFIFPMSLGTDHHGREYFNWPTHEGRDMTWLKTYQGSASIFSYNCVFDFFGGYNAVDDRGVVQYGDHHLIGGKKAWTFGRGHHGIVAQQSLTDDATRYIEIQSGPLPTQSDLGVLFPYQGRHWQEWWYPVHGLGEGFEYATREVALQTERTTDSLTVRAIATGEYPDATLIVSQEGKILQKTPVDLSPEEANVIILDPTNDPIRIELSDRTGEILAAYTSPLPIPAETAPERGGDAKETSEWHYLQGVDEIRGGNFGKARDQLAKSLEIDPNFTESRIALAALEIEAARPDQAINHAEMALKRDIHAAWASYFKAVALMQKSWQSAGNVEDLGKDLDAAYQAAHNAAQEREIEPLGLDLVGRVYLLRGNPARALDCFNEAHARDPLNKKIRLHQAAALYEAGDVEAMRKAARQLRADYPIDLLPAALLMFGGEVEPARFAEQVLKSSGEPEYELLESCLELAELGMIEEARQMVWTAVTADDSPLADRLLPHFYLMHFGRLLGDSSQEAQRWQTIESPEINEVFPSRAEALPILRSATEHNPEDGHAYLALGNLYGGLEWQDEAVAAWQAALELDPQLSPAARNLGKVHWKVEKNLEQAAEYYLQAIEHAPLDQTLYRDAGQILLALNRPEQAIEVLESRPTGIAQRADAIFTLARAYIAAEQYDSVLQMFSQAGFSNWENDRTPHNLFVRAHMERGIDRYEQGNYAGALEDFQAALTYPERLGVGRPPQPTEAWQLYWSGQAYEQLDRPEKAREAYQQALDQVERGDRQKDFQQKSRDALDALD